jgi:hypothetical protein
MALSRCDSQWGLTPIKAPSVHVLRAFYDQELYNVLYAIKG